MCTLHCPEYAFPFSLHNTPNLLTQNFRLFPRYSWGLHSSAVFCTILLSVEQAGCITIQLYLHSIYSFMVWYSSKYRDNLLYRNPTSIQYPAPAYHLLKSGSRDTRVVMVTYTRERRPIWLSSITDNPSPSKAGNSVSCCQDSRYMWWQGHRLDDLGFESWLGKETYPFSTKSRDALEPIQPPIQWAFLDSKAEGWPLTSI